MRKFIITTLFFLTPVLILTMVPILFLKQSREMFYELDKTIKSNSKYLVGYAYDESNYKYLKWKKVVEFNKYSVLALGSSRVLQFRNKMFDTSFYNAGYTIYSLNDFESFLKSIPASKYPDYLVISLDQWMFNKSWDNLQSASDVNQWKNSFIKYPEPHYLTNIYTDLLKRKYGFGVLFNKNENLVGLNALVNNKGFRNDGSMLYGKQIEKLEANDPTAEDFHFADTYNHIVNGSDRYKYADSINQVSLKVLDQFLSFCQTKKIKVIAFLPPFSDKVLTKMDQTKKYSYMDGIYNVINPIFKKYDFELYNFTKLSTIHSDDSEMLDGMHGGERVYLKMLLNILNSNSVLTKVCDQKKLQGDLMHAENRYIVYGY
jgi:hypothetical protein